MSFVALSESTRTEQGTARYQTPNPLSRAAVWSLLNPSWRGHNCVLDQICWSIFRGDGISLRAFRLSLAPPPSSSAVTFSRRDANLVSETLTQCTAGRSQSRVEIVGWSLLLYTRSIQFVEGASCISVISHDDDDATELCCWEHSKSEIQNWQLLSLSVT